MTFQEAERALEDGCLHNPWNDDVCGVCAKEILQMLRQVQSGSTCAICTSRHHSTTDHVSMQAWSDGGGSLD